MKRRSKKEGDEGERKRKTTHGEILVRAIRVQLLICLRKEIGSIDQISIITGMISGRRPVVF